MILHINRLKTTFMEVMFMRRMIQLLLFILLLTIAACSKDAANDNSADNGAKEASSDASESVSDEGDEEVDDIVEEEKEQQDFDEETGEGFIEGLGYVKTVGVGYNDEAGIDGSDNPLKPIKMDSVELEIEALHILEVEPDEDARALFFNDEEKVKAIVVNMKTENTEEKDLEFHPDQSLMITDTGEQIESEMGLMGDVGGEFYGKVKKEGQTWWLLDNHDEDIKSVKMIINPPYDMDEWSDLADEKRLEFEILTYEDALLKDGIEK